MRFKVKILSIVKTINHKSTVKMAHKIDTRTDYISGMNSKFEAEVIARLITKK